jgi:hypothetical protein
VGDCLYRDPVLVLGGERDVGMSQPNPIVKTKRLLVEVNDFTKTPVMLVAMHPLAWSRGDEPSVGLVDLGGDPIGVLWAIATRDKATLAELVGGAGDFDVLCVRAAERILEDIVDVAGVTR